jgi:hypothetical protein
MRDAVPKIPKKQSPMTEKHAVFIQTTWLVVNFHEGAIIVRYRGYGE